jgi:hypothetical protein
VSYLDRKRYDIGYEPPNDTRASRWGFLGIALCLFATPLARLSVEHHWTVSPTVIEIVLGVAGLGCIFGAAIAYRFTQKQVRRDLEDVQNAGRVKR